MRKLIVFITSALLLAACSSIDCPLNSRVFTKYKLAGNSFLLRMSYRREEDVFFFEMKDTNRVIHRDTVRVRKEDHPHFEAVDCNPAIFHTIKGVRYTRHRIDSIVLNNSTVNYDATTTHFLIFFKGKRP